MRRLSIDVLLISQPLLFLCSNHIVVHPIIHPLLFNVRKLHEVIRPVQLMVVLFRVLQHQFVLHVLVVPETLEVVVPWGSPSPGQETMNIDDVNDIPVLEERRVEKRVRIRQAFAPDYGYNTQTFSLLEKSDTMIRIKETHQTKDAPYADAFQVWILWEILTPDPLS